jgi:hypothetical protein
VKRFDRILLPLTLESCQHPAELLDHAAKLLADHGRIETVIGNTTSSCFRVFGGRHWYGYRFPASRQHFGVESMVVLAQKSGLRITKQRSVASPAFWLLSMRNLLKDWGANSATIGIVTGPWLIPWLVASLIEVIALMRGRASILVVCLEKE